MHAEKTERRSRQSPTDRPRDAEEQARKIRARWADPDLPLPESGQASEDEDPSPQGG